MCSAAAHHCFPIVMLSLLQSFEAFIDPNINTSQLTWHMQPACLRSTEHDNIMSGTIPADAVKPEFLVKPLLARLAL